jgi:hypothetical protein
MSQHAALALCFALAIGSASLRAQTPAPAIPDTPAGRVLRAWLDAFNSGDTARMDAYYRQYQPERSAQSELRFREEVGAFDLLTIERSEPRRLEFTLKERNGPRTAYGVIEVSNAEPPRVTAFPIAPIGPNGDVAHRRGDARAGDRQRDRAARRALCLPRGSEAHGRLPPRAARAWRLRHVRQRYGVRDEAQRRAARARPRQAPAHELQCPSAAAAAAVAAACPVP